MPGRPCVGRNPEPGSEFSRLGFSSAVPCVLPNPASLLAPVWISRRQHRQPQPTKPDFVFKEQLTLLLSLVFLQGPKRRRL